MKIDRYIYFDGRIYGNVDTVDTGYYKFRSQQFIYWTRYLVTRVLRINLFSDAKQLAFQDFFIIKIQTSLVQQIDSGPSLLCYLVACFMYHV